jgi:hypothetical protein
VPKRAGYQSQIAQPAQPDRIILILTQVAFFYLHLKVMLMMESITGVWENPVGLGEFRDPRKV